MIIENLRRGWSEGHPGLDGRGIRRCRRWASGGTAPLGWCWPEWPACERALSVQTWLLWLFVIYVKVCRVLSTDVG